MVMVVLVSSMTLSQLFHSNKSDNSKLDLDIVILNHRILTFACSVNRDMSD